MPYFLNLVKKLFLETVLQFVMKNTFFPWGKKKHLQLIRCLLQDMHTALDSWQLYKIHCKLASPHKHVPYLKGVWKGWFYIPSEMEYYKTDVSQGSH